MKTAARISALLVLIALLVSVFCIVVQADEEPPPKNETEAPQLSPEQIALIDCEHQCDVNAKQCLIQGTAEYFCISENNKCWEQCVVTGKPTSPVPPPPLSPAAQVSTEPQPSPELIQCRSQCDFKIKDCANSGTDQNICNQDYNKCNEDCEQQYPLQPAQLSQPNAQSSQLFDYGDAPDPTYPSLKASNGASHLNTEYEWLGGGVTKEADSWQPNVDEKDDGIKLISLYSLPPCSQALLPVNVSVKSRNDPSHAYLSNNLLYLNLLFDWDLNGEWYGAITCSLINFGAIPEHAVVNYPIDVSSWPQWATSEIIMVPVKTGPITQNIWVRATLTYNQNVTFNWNGAGQFNFGETEDYGPNVHSEYSPGHLPSNGPSPAPSNALTSDKGAEKTSESPSVKQYDKPTSEEKNPALPLPKKSDGSECSRNDECQSNICSDGTCTALAEQPAAHPKTTVSTIVRAISNFFSSIFGRHKT